MQSLKYRLNHSCLGNKVEPTLILIKLHKRPVTFFGEKRRSNFLFEGKFIFHWMSVPKSCAASV